MVNYTCPNCQKVFLKKYNFDMHKDRKKRPCRPNPPKPPSQDKLTPQNPPENDQELQEPRLDALVNLTITEDIETTEDNGSLSSKISHPCVYCGTTFTRKDHLKRHIDNRCKAKRDIEDKKNENNILLQHMQELKKQLDNQSKQIEELKNKPQNINNNVVINNSSNKTVNLENKTLNVGTKSVNIVAHGHEDLSTIDLETKLNFLNTLDFPSIIPNMARHLFINNDKPEFKNFRVTDMSRNKSEYHDGQKWITGRADQGVLKIFENINDVLIEPFTGENLEKTIKFIQKDPKKYSKQTITWSKNYCKNLYDTKDKDNIINKNDILDELKLIFYNNREQILNIDYDNDNQKNIKSISTTNQSVNQSVNHSINQSINQTQSINQESNKNETKEKKEITENNQNIIIKKSDNPNLNININTDFDMNSLSSDDEYIPTRVQPRYIENKKIKNIN